MRLKSEGWKHPFGPLKTGPARRTPDDVRRPFALHSATGHDDGDLSAGTGRADTAGRYGSGEGEDLWRGDFAVCAFWRIFADVYIYYIRYMEVEIINRSRHALPQYATSGSAGMDLRANVEEPVTLRAGERRLIPTGIYLALPPGYEAQVRPRSGLALKKGIGLLNSPGTIDSDYRGEVGVILVNLSQEDFVVNDGDRIAQMVIARYEQIRWKPVETLEETERGSGGFGHTGKE